MHPQSIDYFFFLHVTLIGPRLRRGPAGDGEDLFFCSKLGLFGAASLSSRSGTTDADEAGFEAAMFDEYFIWESINP